MENIGSLYSDIPKLNIPRHYIENMKLLKEDNPTLFKEYALRDTLITLIHACYMEFFYNGLKGMGIPLTLSSISNKYIKQFWLNSGYKGYQISNKYLLSNVSSSITPKGLNVLKDVGIKLSLYIASYRGGRNESFMYGYNSSDKMWYDYDLVSAYTTGMSLLGNPDYRLGKILTVKEFNDLKWKEILESYTVLNVSFQFPDDTKYPSIPCNIDENTTIYPLRGSSVITGIDYLLAKSQKCKIIINEIYRIPFESKRYDKKNY